MKSPPRAGANGRRRFAGKGRAGKDLCGNGFFEAGGGIDGLADEAEIYGHDLSVPMSPPQAAGVAGRMRYGAGNGFRSIRVPGKGIRDGDTYVPLDSLSFGAGEDNGARDWVGSANGDGIFSVGSQPRELAAEGGASAHALPRANGVGVMTAGQTTGLGLGDIQLEDRQWNKMEGDGLRRAEGGAEPVFRTLGNYQAGSMQNHVKANVDAKHGQGVVPEALREGGNTAAPEAEEVRDAQDQKVGAVEDKMAQLDVIGELSESSLEMLGVRPDAEDQATECSSSFEDTIGYGEPDVDMEGEEDAEEVQSQHMAGREGNGAGLGEEEEALAHASRRRPLNPEWKTYRRGIEWRCRWLELRMKELKGQEQRYLQIVERLRAAKGVMPSRLRKRHPREQPSLRSALGGASPLKGNWDSRGATPGVPLLHNGTNGVSPCPPPSEPPPYSLAKPSEHFPRPSMEASHMSSEPRFLALDKQQVATENGTCAGMFLTAGSNPKVEDNADQMRPIEPATWHPDGLPPVTKEAFPPGPAVQHATSMPARAEQSLEQPSKLHPSLHLFDCPTPTESPCDPARSEGALDLRAAIGRQNGTEAGLVSEAEGVQQASEGAEAAHPALQDPAEDSDEGEHAARVWAVWQGRSLAKRLLRRRRRKKEEEREDADEYLSRHPLFSRYTKRKKAQGEEDEEGPSQGHMAHHQEQLEEPCEPIEMLLGRIEALQARIDNARYQLARGVPNKKAAQASQRPPLRAGGAPPRPPMYPAATPKAGPPARTGGPQPPPPRLHADGTRVGGSAMMFRSPSPAVSPVGPNPWGISPITPKGGQGLPRRRAADYDINNMVMPVSVGAKYIEHVRHEHIETPQWRGVQDRGGTPTEAAEKESAGAAGPAGDGAAAGGESPTGSSEEDTDDEAYSRRHAPLEAKERQRYLPPPRKGGDGEVGPSKTKGKGKGKSTPSSGQLSNSEREGSPPSPPPLFSGTIPQGKRRKREWGPLTSPVGSPAGMQAGGGPSRVGGAAAGPGVSPGVRAPGEGRASGSSEGPKSGGSSGSREGPEGQSAGDTGSGGQKAGDPPPPPALDLPRLRPPTRNTSGGAGAFAGDGGARRGAGSGLLAVTPS